MTFKNMRLEKIVLKINRHLLLRSPGNTDKAVLDGLNLVDAVLVAEHVEHAKHLVQGGHNLHPIALLANVPGNPRSLRFCGLVENHPKTGMSLKTIVTISKTSQVSTADAPF